jgi:hypothetical protein
MIDSKVILHDIFYGTSVNFLCTYPLALHRWHVWCYIYRSIQHLFTQQMFSVRAVQWYNLPGANTVNVTLRVSWLTFTCVCLFLKQSATHRLSHFLQKYIVLRVCLCREHMRYHCYFPSEGQCCECFTSSRRSWGAIGLGLPFEMPRAVTFSSCEWIINLRTRIWQKFLCLILLQARWSNCPWKFCGPVPQHFE